MAYHSLGSLLGSALVLLAGGSLAAASGPHSRLLAGRSDNSTADCTGVLALSPRCSSNQAPYARDVFYVGGRYIQDASGNRTTGQLYVEKLTPDAVTQPKPVVFFHGGGTSGVSWLNTPDNRKGFGSSFYYFLSYLLRSTWRGVLMREWPVFFGFFLVVFFCVCRLISLHCLQEPVLEHRVRLKDWFLGE